MPASAALKHKETNKFRFKTFSERLTQVNVDAIHRIRPIHNPDVDDENYSEFVEILKKWKDLDLSLHFVMFRKEISAKCKTYKMVIHYKNDILEILQKHLLVPNSLSYQPLLELLVALCIDLSSDFYPHFSKFFVILTKLLDCKDAKRLEWIFTSLSLLFRQLWKLMVADMENVLNMYKGLLTNEHPAHIGEFAGESISFLLRKVPDVKFILGKFFSMLIDDNKAYTSVGQVLFHMIKSSQNHFHSCTPKVLPVMLRFLTKKNSGDMVSDGVFDAINVSVGLMAEHTRRPFAAPVWKVLMCEMKDNCEDVLDLIYLNNLLKLLNTWCDVRQCSRLVNEEEFVTTLETCSTCLVNLKGEDDSISFQSLCRVISTVLHGLKSGLTHSFKQKLINMASKSKGTAWLNISVEFWRSLFKLPNFEQHQHLFLHFCQNSLQLTDQKHLIIKLLVECILTKNSLPRNEHELTNYKPHIFEFALISRKRNDVKPGYILEDIIRQSTEPVLVWHSLIAAQHVKPLANKMCSSVQNLLKKMLSDNQQTVQSLALLCMTVQTASLLDTSQHFEILQTTNFLSLFQMWHSNVHVLFVVDVICAKVKGSASFFDSENVRCLLEKNISSYNSAVRLLSLRVLRHLDKENTTFYDTCILAEETPASIHDIRAKILFLSKLQKHADATAMPGFIIKISVRFLFANFYINFSSLWPQVQDIICSYATSDKRDDFWKIYMELLQSSMDAAIQSEWWKSTPNIRLFNKTASCSENSLCLFDSYVSGEQYNKENTNTRANFFNFRLQLWKTLAAVPQTSVVESYNRVLIGIFFQFLEKEYYVIDQRLSPKQDLKMPGPDNILDGKFRTSSNGSTHCRKDAVRMLASIFTVLARFTNPNSTAHHDKLRTLYYDFVTHSDPELQKVALKCIMTYKDKGVLKYKEQLFNFFDDKKFRDTLTNLVVTEFSKEDRKEVIPVLLRLLFGRMKSKTGLSTGGKSLSSARCSIIMRYVGNVDLDEMQLFIQLIIEPFTDYMNKPLLDSIATAKQQAQNFEKIVPLSRQQGIIGTIKMLIAKFNQHMPIDTYSTLLQLLLSLVVFYTSMLTAKTCELKNVVIPTIFSCLKNLKKLSLECLLSLLQAWPQSKTFSSSEINGLFDTVIWTELPKLVHECSGNPVILLKIFDCFAQRVEYMLFLVKAYSCDASTMLTDHSANSISPMLAIIDVLKSQRCSLEVETFVLDLFSHILFYNSDDISMEDPPNISNTVQDVAQNVGQLSLNLNPLKIQTKLQLGQTILSPFLCDIVSFFVKKMRQSKRGILLPPKHLELLSILSENIADEDILSDLSELLLGYISMICSKHNAINSITLSLQTLLHVTHNPKFIPQMSRLFSKISDRVSRIALVSVINKAAMNSNELTWTCGIVTRLNAWNKRFVEEIDFDSRLTALQDVILHLEANNSEELFQNGCIKILPIMHCCMHTILNYYADLSLRENVSRVLELLVDKVSALLDADFEMWTSVYQLIIKDLILSTVQSGLKSSDEGCRHESVKILSKVVTVFPNEPSLQGLMTLRNTTNPEDDFFESIRHVQMHRRSRAYRKLANILSSSVSQALNSKDKIMDHETLTGNTQLKEDHLLAERNNKNDKTISISHATATKYLLPLAIQTLYTLDFTKLAYLRDSCLDLVKSCASIMPWSGYKRFLLQNIWNIHRHKQSTEIICAILETFPFDISSFESSTTSSGVNKSSKAEDNNISDHEEEERNESKKLDDQSDKNMMDIDNVLLSDKSNGCFDSDERIFFDVTQKLLPKLQKLLSSKDESDQHKLSTAKADIEHYEKKIPLAVAIVSLLRKLPRSVLDKNLSGILIKVVGFLRHKLHDIRIIAGDALINILKLLGASYLYSILKELKSGLSRGFQRHVVVVVVNNLLNSLNPIGEIGMYDHCLGLLLDILNDALFGLTAAEKMVEKVRVKLPEARGRSKAFTAYKSIAGYISKQYIMNLIEPLKNKLDTTHKLPIKKVVKEVLNEICLGLLYNPGLAAVDFLTLIHGIVTENLSPLFKESLTVPNPLEEKSQRPPSCLLLCSEPGRYGGNPTAKTIKMNLHVLIEFALQLLHYSMKRQIVDISLQEHLEMLDPLIVYFTRCLQSTHQTIVADSVRCLTILFRTNLPSLVSNCKQISSALFKILRNHTDGSGNREVAAVTFKSLSVLCSTDHGKSFTDAQLHILLAYAEEDLYDSQRQSHAFNLIKSIFKRGLKGDAIMEVVDKVKKIAIQSHATSSRTLARNLYLYFIKNYAMKDKKLESHIEFILSQLTYEYEDGRMSALELLSSVASDFNVDIISNHCGVMFVPAAAVLINDDSPKCRKAVALIIKLLIGRVKPESKDLLFSFVLQWYKQVDKTLHQRLAAILLSLFAEVEKIGLQKHLTNILPLMQDHIVNEMNTMNSDEDLKAQDHTLFHHLSAFLTILRCCDVSRSSKWCHELSSIYKLTQSLFMHPHDWIRFVCAQITGCVFSAWDAAELAVDNNTKSSFFTDDFEGNMLEMIKSFCDQLKCDNLKELHAEQIIKNLLFISRVLDDVWSSKRVQNYKAQDTTLVHGSILKLLHEIKSISKNEQAFNPKVTSKRIAVLKFMAALCLHMKHPEHVLALLLDPLYRGMNASATHGSNELQAIIDLKTLAAEVLEVVKQRVGSELFTQMYMKVTRKITHKQRIRKNEKAVQLVANPIKAAAVKIKKQQRTKQQRKRKIANLRPEYGLANSKRSKFG